MNERISLNKKNQQWFENYLHACKRQNKSEHTIKNYEADLRKFILWFEFQTNKTIDAVDQDDIMEYKNFLTHGGTITKTLSLKEKMALFLVNFCRLLLLKKTKKQKIQIIEQRPLAISSQKRHLSSLKNFYEFLNQAYSHKEKRFKEIPIRPKIHGLKLKEADVKNTRMLYVEEWVALRESAWRVREKLAISLLYFGGLRISELCSLKFSDFDEKNKCITVIRKGGYRHDLYLMKFNEIYKLLLAHEKKTLGEYLFSGNSLRPLSTRAMYRQLMNLFKKAGLTSELGPHSFRKACATNLYRRTKDLLLVRDYLNHNDAKVTQTYIDKKLIQRDLKNARLH
ncbi:tyrosine-type recombinase/integrase [Halobacteriovorax sp. GB3]|uniref:tyrosine-type recombinase/integrase n=1 Tax=Halobacteriovorax sp. GB3 TaxID=2719615 RepID=UPI0023627270|nr:tyrosine-type recombinase/integrase [Halobacteriovorax sp. GB3]MDD0852907.1 tyrosine-type recombinase/integrase [Halobacteriovorax sp. GB3]